jgi:hypothetical protein
MVLGETKVNLVLATSTLAGIITNHPIRFEEILPYSVWLSGGALTFVTHRTKYNLIQPHRSRSILPYPQMIGLKVLKSASTLVFSMM